MLFALNSFLKNFCHFCAVFFSAIAVFMYIKPNKVLSSNSSQRHTHVMFIDRERVVVVEVSWKSPISLEITCLKQLEKSWENVDDELRTCQLKSGTTAGVLDSVYLQIFTEIIQHSVGILKYEYFFP